MTFHTPYPSTIGLVVPSTIRPTHHNMGSVSPTVASSASEQCLRAKPSKKEVDGQKLVKEEVKNRKGRKAKRKDLKRITQLERKKRKKATRTGDENVRKSENLFPICVRQGCC